MCVYDLPRLQPADDFPHLAALTEARGLDPGSPLTDRPPGAQLGALREAADDVRAVVTDSGMVDAATTCDLVTLPYPTRFGFWRAATTPAPFLAITNRMVVVQWTDADGTRRTLLWEPTDHERAEYTPYFDRLGSGGPLPLGGSTTLMRAAAHLPERLVVERHGTVPGHLRALGIDPAEVDYLAFDHLHTQDVRRLVGTRHPAPDLDSPDQPVPGWFENAELVVQWREWEALRHLHPFQAQWFQPETFVDLPPERLAAVDGDVQLGPGVALLYTPGHTYGNTSLVVRTERGLWTSSENGIAAESWSPEASRVPGLRDWSVQWGQEVVLNANTVEFASWQYNSMVLESLVADPTPEGVFRQCFPSSELTATRLAPGARPTYVHGGIQHGHVHGSSPLAGTATAAS